MQSGGLQSGGFYLGVNSSYIGYTTKCEVDHTYGVYNMRRYNYAELEALPWVGSVINGASLSS